MNSPSAAAIRLGDVVYDQDFIVVYRGLDRDTCSAIVERFDRDEDKWRGRIGGANDAPDADAAKVSWDLEIRNEGAWQDLFERIRPQIDACFSDYLSRSPILRSFELVATGYRIQMYPQNEGHFRWHADAVGANADRVVAMVLYLNDVESGGETEFLHQGIKIAPKAGYLLLFPATWNYMHCGRTPLSGHKYVISSFIKFRS